MQIWSEIASFQGSVRRSFARSATQVPDPKGEANCSQLVDDPLQRAQSPAPLAAPDELIGSPCYYRWREHDFQRRHPGAQPPDYYLNYGEKYVLRFGDEIAPRLSPAGQKWLQDARFALEQAIEVEARRDPEGFDRLEAQGDAFRRFAYETHPKAYLEAGVAELPLRDLLLIGMTPDAKDLLNRDGLRQAYLVAKGASLAKAHELASDLSVSANAVPGAARRMLAAL